MEIVNLKVGEQKVVRFTLKDRTTKEIIDLSGCTFLVEIVSEAKTITKLDADFDKTEAASGVVKITLLTTDLDTAGRYEGILTTVFLSAEIDKSNVFVITVTED